MPNTLDRVYRLLRRCESHGIHPVRLLVVPGHRWHRQDIESLRRLAEQGHELVGHGWHHRAASISSVRHRLHSLLISRHAAEHLSLDSEQIRVLLGRCHAWFSRHGLPRPTRYVPPAWAMGSVDKAMLTDTGFRYFEYLTGTLDIVSRRFQLEPLVGFEADTLPRACALKGMNAVNEMLARFAGPLRIALHPFDDELRLAGDLDRLLCIAAVAPALKPQ